MNVEEYEIIKLKLEIEKLKEPVYKNPAYLGVLATIILSFSGYLIATDEAKEEQIDLLKEQNKTHQNRIHNLEKTRLELRSEHYQRQYEIYRNKKGEIERSIITKENQLIHTKHILEKTTSEYEDYKDRLNKLEKDYENSIQRYNTLRKDYNGALKRFSLIKEKTKEAIEYVSDYGPGYASGLTDSEQGLARRKHIASIEDKKLLEAEIGIFAKSIARQAFDRAYSLKKLDSLFR